MVTWGCTEDLIGLKRLDGILHVVIEFSQLWHAYVHVHLLEVAWQPNIDGPYLETYGW